MIHLLLSVDSLQNILKYQCISLAPTIPICHGPAIPFYFPSGMHILVYYLPIAHRQLRLKPKDSMWEGTKVHRPGWRPIS